MNEIAKKPWLTGKKLLVLCTFGFLTLVVVLIAVFVHSCSSRRLVITKKITTELLDNTEKISQLRKLVLAERSTTEIIRQTEETKVDPGNWWGLEAYIPKASTAIYSLEVKARYSYYVNPNLKSWKIVFEDGVLFVEVPPLEVGYPVIFTETLRAKCNTGWLVLDEKKKLEKFKKEVGVMLRKRAKKRPHLAIVRETARSSLEKFLIEWVIRDRTDEVKAIRIKFADEPQWPGLGGPKESLKIIYQPEPRL
jgi:hypothetical protein